MSKKNIVLLTSKDNFVWASMQEIIPMIEHTWKHLCEEENYGYELICVDDASPSKNTSLLIASDLIVVTCFNTKIARYIKIIRERLQIDTRIFFYLHGLATIALWPTHRFQVLHLMRSNDIFIGTCNGDLKSMQIAFTNAHCEKIPFTILNLTEKSHPQRPFVYIGRLSPQKNLEQLISAYALLSEKMRSHHQLIFYGTEDHLGFPNVGIEEKNYFNKLEAHVRKLNLSKNIIFKGFVDRNQIQEELGRDYIFTSPSAHSDENFGMAAFRALLSGAPCVLSAWGGHLEYSAHYSDQIQYVDLQLTDKGPGIDLQHLKIAMENAQQNSFQQLPCPYEFSVLGISAKLNQLIKMPVGKSEPLKATPIAETIYRQQKEFEEQNQIQRCFDSFKDPAFVAFFKAYGR